MSEIFITNTRPEHLMGCAALQGVCFPNVNKDALFTEAHIANHILLFPEGQFVAIERQSGKVVGMTAGLRTHGQLEQHRAHNYAHATSDGWFWNHDPNGTYYYGADMSVHPDYRGKGIARKFYDVRKALCKRLGLKGQIIGGMIPGFVNYKQSMNVYEYVCHVIAGNIFDPTMTPQLRNGFVWRGMIPNYVSDPPSEGWATLMECPNADYVDKKRSAANTQRPAEMSKWQLLI
ncbi:MAG: GNAT family N-acetyltransferase [Chloroflexota bacterium]